MAISIFMEIESDVDGTITGGCDVTGREGWMECLEMNHQVYIPIDRTTGAVTGNRVHEPLCVTKLTDVATPVLFKQLCTGTNLGSVRLHYYDITKAGKEREFYTIELKNARVISIAPVMYNTRSPEFERLPHLERIQFGYEEITWQENQDNQIYVDNYRLDNA